jgi:hypothetical protein
LIALAAIIIGFGSTIITFRIQREVAMEEAGECLWVPWADWLILLAIVLSVAFVILPRNGHAFPPCHRFCRWSGCYRSGGWVHTVNLGALSNIAWQAEGQR